DRDHESPSERTSQAKGRPAHFFQDTTQRGNATDRTHRHSSRRQTDGLNARTKTRPRSRKHESVDRGDRGCTRMDAIRSKRSDCWPSALRATSLRALSGWAGQTAGPLVRGLIDGPPLHFCAVCQVIGCGSKHFARSTPGPGRTRGTGARAGAGAGGGTMRSWTSNGGSGISSADDDDDDDCPPAGGMDRGSAEVVPT